MTDYLNRCHFGDVRAVLRQMIADGVKVNCIVTSPPYWGLRSYLQADHADKSLEIGSEPTLKEFIATMTEVFMLAREVLADDGTCWINMGDSYAGDRGAAWGPSPSATLARSMTSSRRRDDHEIPRSDVRVDGLKPKDLMGQPWRLAFALQDAGWWLRQDIIWAKPNPMPESTKDRCTKSHEYLFLMTKSERYWSDFEAIKEPVTGGANARRKSAAEVTPAGWATGTDRSHHEPLGRFTEQRAYAGNGVGFGHGTDGAQRGRGRVSTPKASLATTGNDGGYADGKGDRMGRGPGWRVKNNASMDAALSDKVDTRNKRSVWTIPTQPYKGAHFATFPEALVEPCVLAGCPVGGTVLDIFMGSGTTAQVAERLGRKWIGIDLDRRNEALQRKRACQQGMELAA